MSSPLPGLSAFSSLCFLWLLLPILSFPILCFLSVLPPFLSASCPLYFLPFFCFLFSLLPLLCFSISLFPVISVTCPPCFLPSLLPAISASCSLPFLPSMLLVLSPTYSLCFLFPLLPVLSASCPPRCEWEVSHSCCCSWELLLPPCLIYQEELYSEAMDQNKPFYSWVTSLSKEKKWIMSIRGWIRSLSTSPKVSHFESLVLIVVMLEEVG